MVEGAIRYSRPTMSTRASAPRRAAGPAEEALVALARGDAEMPPKIGIHPRPRHSRTPCPRTSAGATLVGIKWVAGGYPGNAVGRRRSMP